VPFTVNVDWPEDPLEIQPVPASDHAYVTFAVEGPPAPVQAEAVSTVAASRLTVA
jgi:hypothetical protein